jgi:hypothetical protein
MRAVADRWHDLENAVADARLTASDKAVFLRRLKRSDYQTAELPPKFTETQAVVAKKTGLTVRQVRRAERHLELHGWLKISGPGARGGHAYVLEVGEDCGCTGRVHEPRQAGYADTVSAYLPTYADTICGHAAGQKPVPTERTMRGVLTGTTDKRGQARDRDRAMADRQAGGAVAIGGHAAGQEPVSTDVSTDPGPGPEAPRAGDL